MRNDIIAYARMDNKNRITVPKEGRKIFNLKEGDQVFWKWKEGYVIFGKVELVIKEKPEGEEG